MGNKSCEELQKELKQENEKYWAEFEKRHKLSPQDKEEIKEKVSKIPSGTAFTSEDIEKDVPDSKADEVGLYISTFVNTHKDGEHYLALVQKCYCPVCGAFAGHVIYNDLNTPNYVSVWDLKCPECGLKAKNVTDWFKDICFMKK